MQRADLPYDAAWQRDCRYSARCEPGIRKIRLYSLYLLGQKWPDLQESSQLVSNVAIWGRIQSREYQKKIGNDEIVNKVAYEVSVSKMECLE